MSFFAYIVFLPNSLKTNSLYLVSAGLGYVVLERFFVAKKITNNQKTFFTYKFYRRMFTATVCAFLIFSIQKINFIKNWLVEKRDFEDRTNNAFLSTIAKRNGIILSTFDTQLIPLRTRRPQLIDAALLDKFCYASEHGLYINNVLKEEWQQIRKEFRVTDIITGIDWRLSLPVVAKDNERILCFAIRPIHFI